MTRFRSESRWLSQSGENWLCGLFDQQDVVDKGDLHVVVQVCGG
jgi:hypothetical protein